jgi:hypothetical protein
MHQFCQNRFIQLLSLLILLFAEPLPAVLKGSTNRRETFQFVNEGRVQATIVVGDQISESEKFSAAELQRYLMMLSGRRIEIISESGVSALPSDSRLILLGDSNSNRLVRGLAQAGLADFNVLEKETRACRGRKRRSWHALCSLRVS